MITKRAKQIGMIAGLYCAVGLVVLVGTVYVTEQNKKKYADIRTQNAEAEATKQLATTIEQTLTLSESDRAFLDTFFISERETIDFITQVEVLADQIGVGLETTQLAVSPPKDDAPSVLQIGFTAKGTYVAVAQFLAALETLPYHRTIPMSSIKKTSENEWEGSIALHVTLQ